MDFSTLPAVYRFITSLVGIDNDEKDIEKLLEYDSTDMELPVGGIKSITKSIQPLLVDPRCIISSTLTGNEYLKDVNTILLNTFSMYYVQAFLMISDVLDVRTTKTLRELGSIDRVDTTKIGPIVLEELNILSETGESTDISLEAKSDKRMVEVNADISRKIATAKVIQLKVREKKSKTKVSIPILIRINPAFTPPDVLDGILGVTKMRHALLTRIDDLRAGNITFFKDFIFNRDLIKEHQKLLMKDNTGLYSEVSGKVNHAMARYAKTGLKGYGAFYNMAIISDTDLKRIERAIGGSLEKKRNRDKLFNKNYITMLVVMDTQWERATFYIRDMDSYSTTSFDSLIDVSNKTSESKDLMSILKSFSNQNGAVF